MLHSLRPRCIISFTKDGVQPSTRHAAGGLKGRVSCTGTMLMHSHSALYAQGGVKRAVSVHHNGHARA